MPHWPLYACAILEDADGRLLLESRPNSARLAAGQLTCFGGRRESDETPDDCLRRELREELGWAPEHFEKSVELRVAGELIAWFYHARLDVEIDQLRTAPDVRALLVSPSGLRQLPLSPWHAAVIDAWRNGKQVVELDA